jgi:hypothetical protein
MEPSPRGGVCGFLDAALLRESQIDPLAIDTNPGSPWLAIGLDVFAGSLVREAPAHQLHRPAACLEGSEEPLEHPKGPVQLFL